MNNAANNSDTIPGVWAVIIDGCVMGEYKTKAAAIRRVRQDGGTVEFLPPLVVPTGRNPWD